MGAGGALRLGVVGFGRLARDYYVPALRTIPGVRLAAVADPLPASRGAATVRSPGVALYADHRAMLAADPLDGVLVASPPSTHSSVWRDAAAMGVPVFVEKPLVLSSELDLLDGSDGSRVMVDFNRRFWPAYRRARDLVARGTLGTPVALDLVLHLDVAAWCTVTSHRLAPAEGGVLHDLGSQAIDLVVEVLGEEPEGVAAETSSRHSDGDHVRLTLTFASGSTATCDLAYEPPTAERLVVRGPRATLGLADPNMALHVRDAGGGSALARRCLDGAAFAYRVLRPGRRMGRASIEGALAAFVDAVRTGGPFVPGFDDAVRNARWLAAAARSAAQGGAARRVA